MAKDNRDVEQLFLRLANSLESSVLPHVQDHYAAMQLRAAREMLLNLGGRLEWRHEDVRASESALRASLQTLSAERSGAAGEDGDLTGLRSDLARLIEDVYQSAADDGKRDLKLARIWRIIRADFDAEAERIKTGMFS